MNINWEAVIKDGGKIFYNGKTLEFIFSKNQSVFIVTEDNKTAQLFVNFNDAADYLVV